MPFVLILYRREIFSFFSTPYNDWRLGLDQMKKGKYVKVSKWINDIKGYFPYTKTLRNKLFRFRKHDVWNAKKIMTKLNPENYTMVSIHVRLTDYKEHLYKLYHFKNTCKRIISKMPWNILQQNTR